MKIFIQQIIKIQMVYIIPERHIKMIVLVFN